MADCVCSHDHTKHQPLGTSMACRVCFCPSWSLAVRESIMRKYDSRPS
jgi:hypothetical protein